MITSNIKGSPGVTTLTMTLAARWPSPGSPLVVELDPSGGVLGSRWQLHDEPGLRSMVAAARYGSADSTPWSQRVALGVDLVPGPADAGAASTVTAFMETGPKLLQELAQHRPVLVDIGRWWADSPVHPVLEVADQVLLMARPELEDIRHLHAALPAVQARCPLVQVVLRGPGRYSSTDIAAFLGVSVVAVLDDDPASADVVAGRRRASRGWTRGHLPRAARTLALSLAGDHSPTGSLLESDVDAHAAEVPA